MFYEATVKGLRAWLLSPAATKAPAVSDKICSVLANVLYWHESAAAMGPERWARLLAMADEQVKRGVEEFGGIPGAAK
jgi:hypothetical protein